MSVARLDITNRTPFAYDYERIDGRLHFAVDPSNSANQRIVDLDRASRNPQGKVEFTSDLVLLQPRDPAEANRRLLFYVVNRGQRVGVPFNRVPARDQTLPSTDEIEPGDGFRHRKRSGQTASQSAARSRSRSSPTRRTATTCSRTGRCTRRPARSRSRISPTRPPTSTSQTPS